MTIQPETSVSDPPLRWKSQLGIFAIGLASFGLFQLFSIAPGLIDFAYSRTINPFFVRLTSRLTGLSPIPILEPLVVIYCGRLLFLAGRNLTRVFRRERGALNSIAAGALHLLRDAGVIVTLFYLMWGFNYARQPLRDRLGWEDFTAPDIETLALFARDAVEKANLAYLEIHDTTNTGTPTPMPENSSALDEDLEAGWRAITEEIGLDPHFANRYGPSKSLLLTPIVSRFGISGFYFPWTAEANVLRDSPPVFRPQSIAHEKAHQRGVGPEEEASFLGYMAASRSPNALARYSAHVFAQIHLLRVLAAEDIDLARSIAGERHAGVQLDFEDAYAYWDRKRGPATAVGRAVNHQFLKANRVTGGVASYRMSVRLIITQLINEQTPPID
jgi:hypothetical protein